jgi:hypothetical protein
VRRKRLLTSEAKFKSVIAGSLPFARLRKRPYQTGLERTEGKLLADTLSESDIIDNSGEIGSIFALGSDRVVKLYRADASAARNA